MSLKSLKIFDTRDFPHELEELNHLYDDLFGGGKAFRGGLVQKIASNIGCSTDQQKLLAQTVEFIHNSSLLHDDLIDRTLLRRGKTSIWKKYSPEKAVLAGDYLLARVMYNLSHHGNIELVQLTSSCITELLEGEWIQDSIKNDIQVNFETLNQIHLLKTSSLFRWCFQAPYLFQETRVPQEILKKIGQSCGLLLQRSDDLIDFNIRNYENKSYLSDLKSGYFNSFATFYLKKRTDVDKQNFLTLNTLAEFDGLPGWSEALLEFDDVNRVLIEETKANVAILKSDSHDLAFITQLETLVEKLYWRK